MGIELHDLFPPRPERAGGGTGPMKRRRLITAGQALQVLDDEAMLVLVCAGDMAQGKPIDEATRERLMQAAARVAMLHDEVRA